MILKHIVLFLAVASVIIFVGCSLFGSKEEYASKVEVWAVDDAWKEWYLRLYKWSNGWKKEREVFVDNYSFPLKLNLDVPVMIEAEHATRHVKMYATVFREDVPPSTAPKYRKLCVSPLSTYMSVARSPEVSETLRGKLTTFVQKAELMKLDLFYATTPADIMVNEPSQVSYNTYKFIESVFGKKFARKLYSRPDSTEKVVCLCKKLADADTLGRGSLKSIVKSCGINDDPDPDGKTLMTLQAIYVRERMLPYMKFSNIVGTPIHVSMGTNETEYNTTNYYMYAHFGKKTLNYLDYVGSDWTGERWVGDEPVGNYSDIDGNGIFTDFDKIFQYKDDHENPYALKFYFPIADYAFVRTKMAFRFLLESQIALNAGRPKDLVWNSKDSYFVVENLTITNYGDASLEVDATSCEVVMLDETKILDLTGVFYFTVVDGKEVFVIDFGKLATILAKNFNNVILPDFDGVKWGNFDGDIGDLNDAPSYLNTDWVFYRVRMAIHSAYDLLIEKEMMVYADYGSVRVDVKDTSSWPIVVEVAFKDFDNTYSPELAFEGDVYSPEPNDEIIAVVKSEYFKSDVHWDTLSADGNKLVYKKTLNTHDNINFLEKVNPYAFKMYIPLTSTNYNVAGPPYQGKVKFDLDLAMWGTAETQDIYTTFEWHLKLTDIILTMDNDTVELSYLGGVELEVGGRTYHPTFALSSDGVVITVGDYSGTIFFGFYDWDFKNEDPQDKETYCIGIDMKQLANLMQCTGIYGKTFPSFVTLGKWRNTYGWVEFGDPGPNTGEEGTDDHLIYHMTVKFENPESYDTREKLEMWGVVGGKKYNMEDGIEVTIELFDDDY